LSLLLIVENAPGKQPFQKRRVVLLANKLRDLNVSIEDHLKAGAQLLRDKHSPAQMVGDPVAFLIEGRKFWKQKMTQVENGLKYHLLMFTTMTKSFSVPFILWGSDESDANDLEPIIKSLQFL